MAEMDTSGGGHHKKGPGVKKAKKASTRVDLTPMVDLGFLLITFFIFTTTMTQPTAMKVFLPDDTGKDTPVKESGALTLLLGKNNGICYYEGQFKANPSSFLFTTFDGIRNIIIQKRKTVTPADFVVIIKPQKESVFQNTVDALDEMTINDVKTYAMIDILTQEIELIKATEATNGIK